MKHYQRSNIKSGLGEDLYIWLIIPLFELKKFIADTFKPYKTENQKNRDWYQLYNGFALLSNTIERVLKVLISFVLPPLALVLYQEDVRRSKSEFFKKRAYDLITMPLWLLRNVIKGVLQVLTAPFTVLIRMPLRLLITSIKGKPKLESNPGFRRVVRQYGDLVNYNGSVEKQGYCLGTIQYKLRRARGGLWLRTCKQEADMNIEDALEISNEIKFKNNDEVDHQGLQEYFDKKLDAYDEAKSEEGKVRPGLPVW